jgi:hypothetical protein
LPTAPIEDERTPPFISWLLVAIGVALLFASVSSGRATYQLIADGNSTHGVVTRVNGAHLTVEFKGSDGDIFNFPQSGLVWGYSVGDRVRVLYSPGMPESTACVATPGALWFPTGLTALLGGSLFLGGLSHLRRRLSRKGEYS